MRKINIKKYVENNIWRNTYAKNKKERSQKNEGIYRKYVRICWMYEGLWRNMSKYVGIWRKYYGICRTYITKEYFKMRRNTPKIWRNIWQIWRNMSIYWIWHSHIYMGLGTWKNSKRSLYNLWDLEKFRSSSLHLQYGDGLWDLEKFWALPLYRLWDLKKCWASPSFDFSLVRGVTLLSPLYKL